MRCNLKLALISVGPLNCADLPVIRGVLVGSTQREAGLQVCGKRSPINGVSKLYTIARITYRKADGLHELRILRLARDLKSDANRAILLDSNLGEPADVGARRCLLLLEIHVPGRVDLWRIIGDGKPDRTGQELLLQILVIDTGDVALIIEMDNIA